MYTVLQPVAATIPHWSPNFEPVAEQSIRRAVPSQCCVVPPGPTQLSLPKASGSDDRSVRLWDTETGALRQAMGGNPDTVWSVSFSPDGRLLASAAERHPPGARRENLPAQVDLWEVVPGKAPRRRALLAIDGVAVTGSSGCSDFHGTVEAKAHSSTHVFEFGWCCRWRAEQEGWTDYFGYPDQIRAAREFDWRCFHTWRKLGRARPARSVSTD